MDNEQQFRTEFLTLCDEYEIDASEMSIEFLNKAYKIAIQVEAKVMPNEVVAGGHWQKIKPNIKCFFVRRIYDSSMKEMQYNLFEERLDGKLYSEFGEDCNEYLDFEEDSEFLIIENKSQREA